MGRVKVCAHVTFSIERRNKNVREEEEEKIYVE
jgi:hypothetical protein